MRLHRRPMWIAVQTKTRFDLFFTQTHTMCCCLHCPICMYILYQPTINTAAVTPYIHALSSILPIGYNMDIRITCIILYQPVHRCNSMHCYCYSTLLKCNRRPYSQLTFFILYKYHEPCVTPRPKGNLVFVYIYEYSSSRLYNTNTMMYSQILQAEGGSVAYCMTPRNAT